MATTTMFARKNKAPVDTPANPRINPFLNMPNHKPKPETKLHPPFKTQNQTAGKESISVPEHKTTSEGINATVSQRMFSR